MELLRASNSGVGPAPNRPPHSLCDDFVVVRVDDGAAVSAIVMVRSGGEASDTSELARRFVGGRCDWSSPRDGCRGGELLILDGTHSCRQRKETDEARGIALLIDVILTEGDEALVVQRVDALTADDGERALVEAKRDRSGDALLGHAHERVVRLTLSGPPATLVHEIGVARGDDILGR